MASTPAPSVIPSSGPPRAAVPPFARLWQVPTFLLGVVTLIATWASTPLWQTPRPLPHDWAIRELRQLLSTANPDMSRALALAEGALQEAEEEPFLTGEAHFLAGSVLVALAEKSSGGAEVEPWRRARALLERATSFPITEDDEPRLRFRLAKAKLATESVVLPALLETLQSTVEAGAESPEEAARAYGMVAEAHLRLGKPDLEAALAATEKQIQQPLVNDVLLAPARLRRGELLLRLKRSDEARQVLRNVGHQAPPAIVAQARQRLAQSLEAEEQWSDAAEVWRQLREDRANPRRDSSLILYRLGLCLRNAGRREEAREPWEESVRLAVPGDETAAATLGLGELYLQGDRPKTALPLLERALREVKKPADWRNAHLPLARVQEVFEAGCLSLRESRVFEVSLELAKLSERLLAPGRARELEAVTAEAWGRHKRQEAQNLKPGVQRQTLEQEAAALLVRAAQSLMKSTEEMTQNEEKTDRFWRAAELYADAPDLRASITTREQFLELAQNLGRDRPEQFGPRIGEGWYRLAEARRAAQFESESLAAFEECLKWDQARFGGTGRFAVRARYHLAEAWRSRGRLDDAQDAHEQNLQILRESRDVRDPEAKEKTLFALGHLCYERRERKDELAKAVSCLESAIEQFPKSESVLTARHQLAESYRLLAEQLHRSRGPVERLTVDSRLRIEQEIARHHEKALGHYRELARSLDTRENRDAKEEELLLNALLKTAESRYLLGEYEVSGQEYEAVATRARQGVYYYTALAGAVRAYLDFAAAQPQTDAAPARVQAARERARKAIQQIRKGINEFDADSRAAWQGWVEEAERRAG